MVARIADSTTSSGPVGEPMLGPDRGDSDGAGTPPLLVSFRYLLMLAFLGSLFLPLLAYRSSPPSGSAMASPQESFLWNCVYGAVALAAFAGFYQLLLAFRSRGFVPSPVD